MQEGKENSVDLVVGDADTISRLLEYLYTFDYSVTTTDLGPLVCNAKIYEAADFYLIPELKKLAAERFIHAANSFWMSRHFLDGVECVYTHDTLSGDLGKELRNIVLRTIFDHSDELLEPSITSGSTDKTLSGLLLDIPELGRDLTVQYLPPAVTAAKLHNLSKPLEKHTRAWPDCGTTYLSYVRQRPRRKDWVCPDCLRQSMSTRS